MRTVFVMIREVCETKVLIRRYNVENVPISIKSEMISDHESWLHALLHPTQRQRYHHPISPAQYSQDSKRKERDVQVDA